MSSRVELFLKNILAFGGAAILSRSISIIGLPLLAWVVYDPGVLGRFDLLVVTGSLGASLANLGMNEAAQKMYFDNVDATHKRAVISTLLNIGSVLSIVFALLTAIVIAIAQYKNYFEGTNPMFPVWAALFVLAFRARFISEVALIVENRRSVIIGIALGEIGFFYCVAFALCWAFDNDDAVLQSIRLASVSIAAFALFRNGFGERHSWTVDRTMARNLFRVGYPLCLSSVFYWALAFSDRVIVGGFLGATALGVYAVCAKFSAFSELIRVALTQGMAYFIYSTAAEEGHNKRIFLIASCLLVSAVFLFGVSQWLAPYVVGMLLPGEYKDASVIIPFLITGPLVLTVFQIVASHLMLAEKTIWIAIGQVCGVFVAVSFSLSTIGMLGLRGPAIGSFLGYMAMLAVVLVAVEIVDNRASSVRLMVWTLPLILIFTTGLFPGRIYVIGCSTIAFLTPACWIFVHRKECLSFLHSISQFSSRA